MEFTDLLYRVSHAVWILTNLGIAFFVADAYHRTGKKHKVLFWLAAAASLGVLGAFMSLALEYVYQPESSYYNLWILMTLISMFEAVVWVLATCFLVKQYVLFQSSPSVSKQEPNKSA